MRIAFALIFGVLFAWIAFSRPEEAEDPEGKGPRYRPYLNGWLMPGYMTTLLVGSLIVSGWRGWDEVSWGVITWILVAFLHISLYFILLLLAQPLLRRYLRAGSCALLWLTPNYLYLTLSSGMMITPRWVVSLPQGVVGRLAIVWLAGALVILGWKIFSHLRFRRWLLRGAEEVSDPDVLAVWQAEMERAREKKPKFRLVISPQASTPMTIGLFSKSVRVVLPRRHYTPEELKLIFRHELVHIGREDAWNKFFVTFCIAMCWFNPFMWLAMGRSSEDLELSCDETVLSSLGEGERRQYAELILRTAGDGRGFTTCLSASASALRYRLKNIVRPARKHVGALFVGVVASLLFLTCGQVGLAYGMGTGEAYIYQNEAESISLAKVTQTKEEARKVIQCRDEEALTNYLSSLTLYQAVGTYDCDSEEKQLSLTYNTSQGTLGVILWENYVRVMPSWEKDLKEQDYYVSGGLDWEKLDGLFNW